MCCTFLRRVVCLLSTLAHASVRDVSWDCACLPACTAIACVPVYTRRRDEAHTLCHGIRQSIWKHAFYASFGEQRDSFYDCGSAEQAINCGFKTLGVDRHVNGVFSHNYLQRNGHPSGTTTHLPPAPCLQWSNWSLQFPFLISQTRMQ